MTGEKVNYCAVSLFTVGNDRQFKFLKLKFQTLELRQSGKMNCRLCVVYLLSIQKDGATLLVGT